MSTDEAMKLIDESKRFLEPYKAYGPMINDGIAQLEKLEKLIRDKAYEDAFKLSSAMREQVANYSSFVPQLADNLEKVREILRRVS
jgi:hypothetical protein